MTQVAGRPLRADARRNRERVLTAARAVFSEHGREAQMDDVARHAMVGVGTVYRHFPTKEALIDALVLDTFERILAATQEQLAREDDPWDALAQSVWSSAELLAGNRAVSDVMSEDPGSIHIDEGLQQKMGAAMATLIERAQAAGTLRPDVIVDDIVMVVCGIGTATRKPHTCQGAWRRHVGIVLDGMRASSAVTELPTNPCS